jgi:pimeloyl-ACP methyl ester carboxylesterase
VGLGSAGLTGLHAAARRMGVPFSSEALPRDGFVRVNGLRHHYLDWDGDWGEPERPAVLLLHGFAQSGHSFDFVSLALCERFRVIALDLRGHGESDWSEAVDYRRESMLTDVVGIMNHLELDSASFVGLSLGGTISYMLAAARPELVRSLVIVDIAPRVEQVGVNRVRGFVEGDDYFDSMEEMIEAVRAFRPGRTEEQLKGSVLRNAKRLDDGRWSWKYDPVMRRPESPTKTGPDQEKGLWRALEAVRCPTLVVRGAESDIVSPETAAEMVSRIPDARGVTVEAAGHLVPGDNPVGFIRAIQPFLLGIAAI